MECGGRRRAVELDDMLKFSNQPQSARQPVMCQHVQHVVITVYTVHGGSNHETL